MVISGTPCAVKIDFNWDRDYFYSLSKLSENLQFDIIGAGNSLKNLIF
jgi:hypothetical protein